MAAQVGCLDGDDHDVADPDVDVVVAPRAQVGLAGLVGLDPADLDLVYLGIRAHSTSTTTTATDAAT